jgi:hypothetical protein
MNPRYVPEIPCRDLQVDGNIQRERRPVACVLPASENGGEMTALSADGGPSFGAHAFTLAGEWTCEGKRAWCALMKENRSSQGQG